MVTEDFYPGVCTKQDGFTGAQGSLSLAHLPFECSASHCVRCLFVHCTLLEALMLYRPVCLLNSLMIP